MRCGLNLRGDESRYPSQVDPSGLDTSQPAELASAPRAATQPSGS